jgi:hypothetical protein
LAALAYAAPGRFLYWSSGFYGETIGRATIVGTAVEESFISGTNGASGVAVDSQHVYWFHWSGAPGERSIGRANLDGADIKHRFITGINQVGNGSIVVAGGYIYWTGIERRVGGVIGRAKLDGTDVDRNFIQASSFPLTGLAVHGDRIYWTTHLKGSIGWAKLDGTNVTQFFITGGDRPYSLAVDGQHLYWANANGTIGRANLDGTAVEQKFITDADASAVAVGDQHIYWSSGRDAIARANLNGTDVNLRFVTGLTRPLGLAVTETPQRTQVGHRLR